VPPDSAADGIAPTANVKLAQDRTGRPARGVRPVGGAAVPLGRGKSGDPAPVERLSSRRGHDIGLPQRPLAL